MATQILQDTSVLEPKGLEHIHWSELYKSGKVSGTATAPMLRGEVNVKKECKLDGDANDAGRCLRTVIYDRDFIVNQVATYYRFVLTDCNLDEWLSVCSDAWRKHNDNRAGLLLEEVARSLDEGE